MRFSVIPLVGGLLLVHPPMQAQKPVRPAAAAKQAERRAQKQATRPVPRPGELAVDKLSAMTPEQRDRALAALPPERRQRVEKNLQDFQNLPAAQQERQRRRLELLNSLPRQQQVQVRQSLRDFNQMAPERKQAINRELRRIAPMSDEQRRAHLTTEDVRNRFTADELQAMQNLSEILPQP